METEDNKKEFIQILLKNVAVAVIFALVLSKIITNCIFVIAYIPSRSMCDTIKVGDKVFVNIIGTKFGNIKRGDIIVFRPPEGVTDKEYLIKRVIGLPGETIKIEDGIVFIDGKELKEDYVYYNNYYSCESYIVPENSYFVLGDNRAESFDARYWGNKYVDRKSIIGKAVCRVNNDFEWYKLPEYNFQ